MSDPVLRVALLGAGDMGSNHAAAWRALGHRLVVVADADPERAARASSEWGFERTTCDFRQAASASDVDVVVVALPLRFHAPAVILAAEHGKHVLTEKPLCRNFAEADAMEAAVSRAGTVFGVGFQRNLAEGVGLLRGWVAEGRFGYPLVFTSDLLQTVRPKPGMMDRDRNGGPLVDGGCHYYLLWQTVFRSRAKSVFARGGILARHHPETATVAKLPVDTAVVTVEYESGDLAAFTATWGVRTGVGVRGRPDRLIGPLGAAEGTVSSVLEVWDGSEASRVEIEPRDLHRVEAELFSAAVRGGAPFPTGFHEGREVLAVTEAVFRSLQTGRPERVREV
jgi:myo-inositol 2-dehydrogenase/D-chiro-inositol 1-dehydrogenase